MVKCSWHAWELMCHRWISNLECVVRTVLKRFSYRGPPLLTLFHRAPFLFPWSVSFHSGAKLIMLMTRAYVPKVDLCVHLGFLCGGKPFLLRIN